MAKIKYMAGENKLSKWNVIEQTISLCGVTYKCIVNKVTDDITEENN